MTPFHFFAHIRVTPFGLAISGPKLRVIGKRCCNRAIPHFDANRVWLFQTPLDRVIAIPPDALFLTEDVGREL